MAVHESHGSLPAPRFERPTRVLIAVAPFYRDIADALLAGATAAIAAAGATQETVEVPGALRAADGDPARQPVGRVRRLRRARLRDPRRDHALRDGLQRSLARADAARAGRALHRQRHPDGGEPRAGRGPRRSRRPEQGRRRRRGGAASGGARPPLRPSRRGLPEGSFRVAGDSGTTPEMAAGQPASPHRGPGPPDALGGAVLRGAGAVPDGGRGRRARDRGRGVRDPPPRRRDRRRDLCRARPRAFPRPGRRWR